MENYFFKIYRMLKELLVLPFRANLKTTIYFYSAILTSVSQIIRDKNFDIPHLKMRGKLCVFKFFGKKILLDGLTFGYAGEIYLRRCYFHPPAFIIRRNDTIVDLGASMGAFSIAAAILGEKVIAVDINNESLRKLEENARLNNCLNKIKVVLGVVGSGGMCINQMKAIPTINLNQLLEENHISVVDFLKIDIEGSEFDLLKNNNDWLKKIKKIVMEIHPFYGKPKELKAILEENGFNVFFKNLNNRIVDDVVDPAVGYLFAEKR